MIDTQKKNFSVIVQSPFVLNEARRPHLAKLIGRSGLDVRRTRYLVHV